MGKDQELKTGTYRALKDIVDIDFKEIANMDEVIKITDIEFDRARYRLTGRGKLNIFFQRFGISKEIDPIVLHGDDEQQCKNQFCRIFKKIE